MAVRHRKIVGETIKGNCADWNDLHNIYNMATFELISLVNSDYTNVRC